MVSNLTRNYIMNLNDNAVHYTPLSYLYTLFIMFVIISAVIITGMLLVTYITNVFKQKWLDVLLAAVIFVGMVFYVGNKEMGSVFMQYLIGAVIVASNIRILALVPFRLTDYATVFAVALYVKSEYITGIDQNYFVIMIFIGIFMITKFRDGFIRENKVSNFDNKKLKTHMQQGNVFNAWITFAVCTMSYVCYTFLYDIYIYDWYWNVVNTTGQSDRIKLLLYLWILTIYLLVNMFVIMMVRKLFKERFEQFSLMGSNYKTVEKSFVAGSAVMICVLYGIDIMMLYTFRRLQNSHLDYFGEVISTILIISVIVLQIFFLTLLLRLEHLKVTVKEQDQHNSEMSLYLRDLEKNMQEIKNLKHDIKNVMITMKAFVSRNDDEEMKSFFHEKIYPFVDDEIKKNDIYTQLQAITNEQFKAFLHYKILQGIEYGINMTFECTLDENEEMVLPEFTEIVRILGILIDNAIEECIMVENGNVNIKVSLEGGSANYIVSNSVRESTRQKGIIAGTSTKGLGRGHGLSIVEGIVEKYDNVLLNSYFREERFVQNLTVLG